MSLDLRCTFSTWGTSPPCLRVLWRGCWTLLSEPGGWTRNREQRWSPSVWGLSGRWWKRRRWWQSCAKVFIWIRYRYSQGTDIYFETNINIDIINFLFRNQYQYRYYNFYYFEIDTNINIQNASFRYRYQYRNCNNHILADISKRYQYRNQYFT